MEGKQDLLSLLRQVRSGSLTPEQMKVYKEKFRRAEILLGAKGNEPVTLKVPARPKEPPQKPPKRREPER